MAEVPYDQGPYLIQGRGPAANGNFTICPIAEMGKFAQASLDSRPGEAVPHCREGGGRTCSCSGSSQGSTQLPRAPMQKAIQPQKRGAGDPVPQILEEKKKKAEQTEQSEESDLAATVLIALRLFFLFS